MNSLRQKLLDSFQPKIITMIGDFIPNIHQKIWRKYLDIPEGKRAERAIKKDDFVLFEFSYPFLSNGEAWDSKYCYGYSAEEIMAGVLISEKMRMYWNMILSSENIAFLRAFLKKLKKTLSNFYYRTRFYFQEVLQTYSTNSTFLRQAVTLCLEYDLLLDVGSDPGDVIDGEGKRAPDLTEGLQNLEGTLLSTLVKKHPQVLETMRDDYLLNCLKKYPPFWKQMEEVSFWNREDLKKKIKKRYPKKKIHFYE